MRQGLDAEPGNAALQALAKSLADSSRTDRTPRSGKKSAARPASPLKKFLHKLFGN